MRVLLTGILIISLCFACGCAGSAKDLTTGVDPQPAGIDPGSMPVPDVADLPRTVSALDEQFDFKAPVASSAGFVIGDPYAHLLADNTTEWAVYAASGYGAQRLPRTFIISLSVPVSYEGGFYLGFADRERDTWIWQELPLGNGGYGNWSAAIPLDGLYYDPDTGIAYIVIVAHGQIPATLMDGWLQAAPPGDILPGDYTISTDNPSLPADGIEIISGSLTINADVASPAGLADLRFIGGDLIVEAADGGDALSRLAELGNLETIGGSLRVQHVQSITALELPLLQHVGGGIWVTDNPQLAAVKLPSLAEVGRHWLVLNRYDCSICDNPVLAELELPALGKIHYGSLDVCYIPAWNEEPDDPPITSIDLPELSIVGNRVRFCGMPHLQAVTMPKLIAATRLEFSELDSLTSLSIGTLYKLYELRLESLGSLTTLEALGSLGQVRNIYINKNPVLTDINGLSGLHEAGGTIWIDLNDQLTHVFGLGNLNPSPASGAICHRMVIRYNPSLVEGDDTVWALIDELGGRDVFETLSIYGNAPDW